MTKINKQAMKKSPEELEMYMHFKKRGFAVPPKKGKGSFKRKSRNNSWD